MFGIDSSHDIGGPVWRLLSGPGKVGTCAQGSGLAQDSSQGQDIVVVGYSIIIAISRPDAVGQFGQG